MKKVVSGQWLATPHHTFGQHIHLIFLTTGH
jgi:hypothetical protein